MPKKVSPIRQVVLQPYIPFMLGSIFILMAFDHALHAYAENYGRYWFFKDYDRTVIFDYFYLIDQSIIMPVLFFCVGNIFIYHVKNNPSKDVATRLLLNYLVPFVVGILFIVPLLVFPRYSEYQDPNISLLEYYQTLYFSNYIQAGPFWVMYALTLYSLITWWLIKWCPQFINKYIKPILFKPINFVVLTFIVLLCSDLMWGAPWWIGFGKVFYLQGSRFISNFIFFLMGALWCLNQLELSDKLIMIKSKFLYPLVGGLVVLSALGYGYFCTNFEAYPPHIKMLMHDGVSFTTSLSQIWLSLDAVIKRIALMTLLMVTLFLIYLKLISSPRNYGKLSYSLGMCCYGIFIFHESITVWMQFYLVNFDLNPYLKVAIIFPLSVALSWGLTSLLIRIKIIRKILVLN